LDTQQLQDLLSYQLAQQDNEMHLLKLDTFDTIVLRQALKDTMAQHGVLSVEELLLVDLSMRTQQRLAQAIH
jgi:hypothetical protein